MEGMGEIEEEELSIALTKMEKVTRNRFVDEYLIDRDATKAAARIGYSPTFAGQYGAMFMQETYTLKRIADKELNVVEKDDAESHRQKIIAALYREANHTGEGSSHGARVAALAKLSLVFGLDAPVKSEVQTTEMVQFYIPDNGRAENPLEDN
jgi:hypothetical protein